MLKLTQLISMVNLSSKKKKEKNTALICSQMDHDSLNKNFLNIKCLLCKKPAYISVYVFLFSDNMTIEINIHPRFTYTKIAIITRECFLS